MKVKDLRIWTETEELVIPAPYTVEKMVAALKFKACNIQAKADPELFEHAAEIMKVLAAGYMTEEVRNEYLEAATTMNEYRAIFGLPEIEIPENIVRRLDEEGE